MPLDYGEREGFWRPNSRRLVVPGRSNHERPVSVGGNDTRTKLTMYERTNAAIEEFWESRGWGSLNDNKQSSAAHGEAPCEPLQYTAENANKRCNIILGQDNSFYSPDTHNPTRDLEEKERSRTRGIPGYTGTQPPVDKVHPQKPDDEQDPSKTYAINAFDGRRARVKGIPGYTGHQPPGATDDQEKNPTSTKEEESQGIRFIDEGHEVERIEPREASASPTNIPEGQDEGFPPRDPPSVSPSRRQRPEDRQEDTERTTEGLRVKAGQVSHRDNQQFPSTVSTTGAGDSGIPRFPIKMHLGF